MPSITFAVQQLSQHTHDFSQAHWTAVKHVICYLKGTHDAGIVLHRCEVCLRYYTKSLRATVFMQTVYSTVVRGYS